MYIYTYFKTSDKDRNELRQIGRVQIGAMGDHSWSIARDGFSLNTLPAKSFAMPTTLFLFENVAVDSDSQDFDRFQTHLYEAPVLVSDTGRCIRAGDCV